MGVGCRGGYAAPVRMQPRHSPRRIQRETATNVAVVTGFEDAIQRGPNCKARMTATAVTRSQK